VARQPGKTSNKPTSVKVYNRLRTLLAIGLFVLVGFLWFKVNKKVEVIEIERAPKSRTWSEIVASDTLNVVTLPTSFTAFQYRGRWYGNEYENAKTVAEALGLKLNIMLVKSENAIADSLFYGAADVAIWPMAYSVVEGYWYLRPTGPRWADGQCIASARKLNIDAYKDTLLTDSAIAELPKYKLSLIKDSHQWNVYNDRNIRKQFDFRPYVIDTIPSDSLNTELLTDSMIVGLTEAVMLRCNVARLMRDYYPTLVVSDTLPGSIDSLAWMLTNVSDTLRYKIDSVSAEQFDNQTPHYTIVARRKKQPKNKRPLIVSSFKMKDGAISPYDDIFKRKAKEFNLDWRMLAGIAFIESRFNHTVVSHKGPIGLMQLMPQTARIFGHEPEDVLDPDLNIELACRLYVRIADRIRNRVPGISDEDLMCVSLAGYNAGIGHVYDAIRLAETLGYKANVWPNNVEHCLRLKSDPQYYRMSVVKQGKFNGAFTINYVNQVMAAYHTFCQKVPKD